MKRIRTLVKYPAGGKIIPNTTPEIVFAQVVSDGTVAFMRIVAWVIDRDSVTTSRHNIMGALPILADMHMRSTMPNGALFDKETEDWHSGNNSFSGVDGGKGMASLIEWAKQETEK